MVQVSPQQPWALCKGDKHLEIISDPQETMSYSRAGIISSPRTWHIVGAQSKLYTIWHPQLKYHTLSPFSLLSSTFPVNAVLISQETNEELTSPARD